MSWFVYAFISAISGAGAALLEKRVLFREHAMEFAGVLAFFNALFSLPFLFFVDFSQIRIEAVALTFLVSILAATAFLMFARGIRHMEVSAASPLFSIEPGITALFGFFILGEALTHTQVVGIALLVFGSYFLQMQKGQGLLEPVRIFMRSKYIHYILGAMVVNSTSSIMDRIILSHFNMPPAAYVAFTNVFIFIDYFIMLSIFYDGINGLKHGMRETRWLLPVVSIMFVVHNLAGAQAISLAYIGLVMAIIKTSGLFTTLIGGELFHENDLLRRTTAAVLMFAAVLLIIIR